MLTFQSEQRTRSARRWTPPRDRADRCSRRLRGSCIEKPRSTAPMRSSWSASKTQAAAARHDRCSVVRQQGAVMTTLAMKDGTEIYYKDWGSGQPVVFSHGWPLSADAFEDQMIYLASRGYRCIA